MTQTPDYVSENALWTERLSALIDRLTDADLTIPMEAGWTVSAVLAHMAFWDIRVVTLLEKWETAGQVTPSEIDGHLVNEVSRRLCLAIPPRDAAALALTWAKRTDQAIAAVNPQRAAEIHEIAPNTRIDRAHHRLAHVTDIEKALGAR
jgi:hypothetical protein